RHGGWPEGPVALLPCPCVPPRRAGDVFGDRRSASFNAGVQPRGSKPGLRVFRTAPVACNGSVPRLPCASRTSGFLVSAMTLLPREDPVLHHILGEAECRGDGPPKPDAPRRVAPLEL